MTKLTSTLSSILTVGLLFMMLSVMPMGTYGKPDIRKAEKVSDLLATNVSKAKQVTDRLELTGKITATQARNLGAWLEKADEAVQKLNERAHALRIDNQPDTASDREEVSNLLRAAADALSRFKAEGIAALNPVTQVEFDPILKKISGNIRSSAAAIDCPPLNANCVKCQPDPPGNVICIP